MQKKRILWCGLAFYMFFLSGCMVGPDYRQPQFFSQKAIEKTLNLHPDTICSSVFNPDEFQDKTLSELISLARQKSPTIRMALLRLRQARQTSAITAASLGPTFDAAAEYNYAKESRNMGHLVKQDYYRLGLDMSWELDIFGGQRRRLEAARASEAATLETLKSVYVSLTAEVADSYIQLRTAEELLYQTRQNLILQQELYQLVKDQEETGLTDSISLKQSQYLLENTKSLIPQYEYEREKAQNALALLTGMLPGELNYFLSREKKNLVKMPFKYDLRRLYVLPATVIQNRPDVRSAEKELIAQNALIGAAIADLYPSFSISALLGFESLTYGRLWSHKSYGYTATPQIGFPLFHFGALKNNVVLQELVTQEKQTAYEQQLLIAASEIKNAMTALDKSYYANKALQRSYREITRAASLIREKYKNGLIDYSDVLDSEQRRLSAQTDLIQSNKSLYQGLIVFYKSIGGEVNSEFCKNKKTPAE